MSHIFVRRPLVFLAPLIAAGCTSSADKSEPKEPMPAYQVALVRNDRSDQINVASALLTDADWQAIGGCPNLRTLLLDNPAQQVSAANIEQLSPLENLEHLRIRGRGI